MMKVFVEQPLALPGFAKKTKKIYFKIDHTNRVINGQKKYFFVQSLFSVCCNILYLSLLYVKDGQKSLNILPQAEALWRGLY